MIFILFTCQFFLFLSVDTKQMEALIENHQAISAKKLSEIVVPISPNFIRSNIRREPQINYSYLGETLMNLIRLQPTMEKCQQSSSFCKLKSEFESEEKLDMVKKRRKMLSPEEYFDRIWNPCFKEWQTYCNRFIDEKITIGEIEDLFDITLKTGLEKTSVQKIRKELTLMIGDRGNQKMIDTRLFQIEQYYTLLKCVEAAEKINKIKKALEITSDIGELKNFALMVRTTNS